MNMEPILRGIDAEIEKLQRVRAILLEFLEPETVAPVKLKRTYVRKPRVAEAEPEPRVVIVPPRQKREYTRRPKPANVEPTALSAPASDRPVFVPKAVPAVVETPEEQPTDQALEAAMRRQLLGPTGSQPDAE